MTYEKRTDPEKNFWYHFMKTTLDLDKKSVIQGTDITTPDGYHWLFSLNRLLSIDVEKIQRRLPDEHPLKLLEIPEWNNIQTIYKPRLKKEHPLKDEIDMVRAIIITTREYNKIDLSNLDFKEDAYFLNFIFPIDVDFNNTKFVENVYFNGSVFTKNVNFKDAVFCGKISKFRDVAFDKIANFTSARFKGYANFKGSIIKGRTSFQKAIFESHAPRFYEAKFSNEMIWAGIDLPSLAKADNDYFDKEDERFDPNNTVCCKIADANHAQRIQENQNSYENTAILLEEKKKYHDQHFFFRKEMRCRRWLGGRFNRFIYRLYEWFADYGYGVGRATIYWFLHIFFGMIAIFITVFCIDMTIKEIIFCSISTSFANANPFVFIGIKDGSLMACYTKFQIFSPVGFGYIRGIQTIIGIPLLFLLLTTLRIRFRLK